MNITDVLIKLLPGKIVRKNKCYNLFIMKDAGDDNIKVGYHRTNSHGKYEVLTVVEGKIQGNGLRNALMTTMQTLMSDGFAAMGYQAQA